MGALVFLCILVLGGILVVPFLILSKVNGISARMSNLERGLKEFKERPVRFEQRPGAKKEEGQAAPGPLPPEIPPPASVSKPIPVPVYAAYKAPEHRETTSAPAGPPVETRKPATEPVPVTPPVTPPASFPKPGTSPEPVTIPAPAPPVPPSPRPAQPAIPPASSYIPRPKKTIRAESVLSRIGIVTLVLGIAFFVKYAIDKQWINEIGRVAIGLLTGGLIIGIAHKLRKKYSVFSAIMVGGGISVLYITITLALREYHIFSQPLAFGLLIGVTVFSVALSLLYDRKELALFSLLGGYASPLLVSSGDGNYIVLFSFIFILNCGMLAIALQRRWRIIGIVGYLCTVLFYWTWLLVKFEDQQTGAILFAGLFFVQFYLLALFDHLRSGKHLSPFQVILLFSNNLSMLAASVVLFKDGEFNANGIIAITLAVVNAIVMQALFRLKNVDRRLIYLVIALVLSFVSLAIPLQLNGHVITLFWAAETVIVLWLWKKSELRFFQGAYVVILCLTFISYLIDVSRHFADSPELPVIANRLFITGLTVAASLIAARTILKRGNAQAKGIVDNTLLACGLTVLTILTLYIVPLIEINYQLPGYGNHLLRPVLSVYYTMIYIACVAFVYRKKTTFNPWMTYGLVGAALFYLLASVPLTAAWRSSVFTTGEPFSPSVFLLHYTVLPALAYILYTAARNLKNLPRNVSVAGIWILVTVAVIALTAELNNTVAQVAGNGSNLYSLYDIRSFGYPILWGVMAFILMVWGLKRKEATLRRISLIFFALIIAKFYISDVWGMSQGGRIVSFVVLGVILLTASFLIQRIKTLVKDHPDEPEKEQNP